MASTYLPLLLTTSVSLSSDVESSSWADYEWLGHYDTRIVYKAWTTSGTRSMAVRSGWTEGSSWSDFGNFAF
ncbi:hypothetical protein BFJ70_g6385 [Fusarium oxysporum]|uniref:Uncharacterized protein n=1 Tax=Fusarium oxysporum TaxID=5507 RepID=A0A420TB40_FUSOX|nr:hypothetical protein BFJ68_g9593 [Fusarium oxysporum]RKL38752.1 hypothetical protein BFJ70_g6385 [Fusarium oxysporum]